MAATSKSVDAEKENIVLAAAAAGRGRGKRARALPLVSFPRGRSFIEPPGSASRSPLHQLT